MPSKLITWETALGILQQMKAIIEVQERGKIYGGPIKQIQTKGDDVIFRLLWSAHYDIATDKWTAAEHEEVVIFRRSITSIRVYDSNHLLFQNTEIICAMAMPAELCELRAEDVINLDLANLPKPPPPVDMLTEE